MRIPVVVFAVALVAACTTGPVPVTTASGPAAMAVAVSGAQDAGLATLINNFRASEGRGPMVPTAALTQAAAAHAQDMVAQGYFSHTGLNGSSVGARVRAAGCSWSGVAENIAQGQTSAEQAMGIWVNSSGHRANLLGPYPTFGAARVGNTWVLVFASGC